MKRSFAYTIFLLIIFGVGIFSFIVDRRLEKQSPIVEKESNISENDMVEIIFREELSSNKKN